eukprot:Lithocolla_globosa_v1_NODE_3676_length_1609_cov_4.326255.p2 type:complete len:184 gc:universal NODE_3676_length_1609_cov_4.326255:333-884(+)
MSLHHRMLPHAPRYHLQMKIPAILPCTDVLGLARDDPLQLPPRGFPQTGSPPIPSSGGSVPHSLLRVHWSRPAGRRTHPWSCGPPCMVLHISPLTSCCESGCVPTPSLRSGIVVASAGAWRPACCSFWCWPSPSALPSPARLCSWRDQVVPSLAPPSSGRLQPPRSSPGGRSILCRTCRQRQT